MWDWTGPDMIPEKVHDLKGRVVSGSYGKGSKSERVATFLETTDGKRRYLLRRKDGPAYGDKVIAELEGKVVVCDGFLVGSTLLAESYEIME